MKQKLPCMSIYLNRVVVEGRVDKSVDKLRLAAALWVLIGDDHPNLAGLKIEVLMRVLEVLLVVLGLVTLDDSRNRPLVAPEFGQLLLRDLGIQATGMSAFCQSRLTISQDPQNY